jgi:hypothetical protein
MVSVVMPLRGTQWVTALVHLRWGVPLAWRFGKSNAGERFHLLKLLSVLARQALLAADAGYVGFQLTQRMVQDNVLFLSRMSGAAAEPGLERGRKPF